MFNIYVDLLVLSDRVESSRLARVTVLNLKALRTAEHRRKLFNSNFEHGRDKRNSLYERLKPRLNINSRNLIEKKKIELKKKKPRSLDQKSQKRKSSTLANPLSDGSLGGSNNIDDFITSFDNDDNDDDSKPGISRRSSLKSSLIEAARNESFDSGNMDNLQR